MARRVCVFAFASGWARVRSCVELATRRTLPARLAWFGLVRFCSWAGARVLQPSLVGYFGLCLFG